METANESSVLQVICHKVQGENEDLEMENRKPYGEVLFNLTFSLRI